MNRLIPSLDSLEKRLQSVSAYWALDLQQEDMSSLGGLLADYGSDSDTASAERTAEKVPPVVLPATHLDSANGENKGVVAERTAGQTTGSGSENVLGVLPAPKNPTKRFVRFTLPIDYGFLKEATDEVQRIVVLT